METILNKQSQFSIYESTKRILFEIITYLFIGLFIYTAASKFMTLESFIKILGRSPLVASYSVFIAWAVPVIEVVISTMLVIPKAKKIGLLASLALMILFTAFLIYGIVSGSKLPCHCGGVIASMSWKQHIWFNIGLIVLAFIGLKLYKK